MWRDRIPQKLQELGTPEACQALRQIIDELPELKEQLQWRLPQAEALTRRKTWQPLTPEELLQLVINQEPSTLDLSNQLNLIDQRTEKMEKEPRVDKSIHITGSNVPGVINTGDSSIDNKSTLPPDSRKLDWKFWLSTGLTILIGLGSVAASGVLNDEIRSFFFRESAPSSVEESINSDEESINSD